MDAGRWVDVARTYGSALNPAVAGHRHVKDLTAATHVPTLELEDGTLVDGSEHTIDCAKTYVRASSTINFGLFPF